MLNAFSQYPTHLLTPAGAPFGVSGHPAVAPLSNLIGAGAYAGQGLAYDLSQDLIVPIVIANTNVALF